MELAVSHWCSPNKCTSVSGMCREVLFFNGSFPVVICQIATQNIAITIGLLSSEIEQNVHCPGNRARGPEALIQYRYKMKSMTAYCIPLSFAQCSSAR